MIKTENFIDITKEMLERAVPNSHEVKDRLYFEYENKKYFVDNKNVVLDYSLEEKEIALWLESTFGGEIYMLPRVNYPKNIQSSDYLWNNEYWDLKTIHEKAISTTRAVDNVIKTAKKQATNIILNITKTSLNINNIVEQVERIFGTSGREWVNEIMIVNDYKLIKLYIRKKQSPLQAEWEVLL
ncbi:MAG: hypothetical protein NC483_04150 [Ruminococcus sp.]|nr:hypothetical protein [Ruminococcus sp.]